MAKLRHYRFPIQPFLPTASPYYLQRIQHFICFSILVHSLTMLYTMCVRVCVPLSLSICYYYRTLFSLYFLSLYNIIIEVLQ